MKKSINLPIVGILSMFVTGLGAADLPRTASPPGANVYIVSPAHGAVVESPFTVVFGLSGMGVAPAGTDKAKTGHHHLLVDGEKLPPSEIPLGAQVTHFGGGQTQTSLTLSPGKHTLQLILGDKLHIPHDPPVVSERISITVK